MLNVVGEKKAIGASSCLEWDRWPSPCWALVVQAGQGASHRFHAQP